MTERAPGKTAGKTAGKSEASVDAYLTRHFLTCTGSLRSSEKELPSLELARAQVLRPILYKESRICVSLFVFCFCALFL